MSFFWHDYETFGIDPQRDHACQFAGVRTDEDFNVIDEPLTLYCQLGDDYLPHPQACVLTGITPQIANEKGVCEAEFIGRIHQELALPGTCSLGYNSIRFDDEFTRNLLYRNFYDPYAREWQNNNSRWDLIDVVRAARALRPDGIEWPDNEDGVPSFRLELLSQANGLQHEAAHDALSDVYATIALAKLVHDHQPKLYQFLLTHRFKQQLADVVKLGSWQPLLHVSRMYPAKKNCLAVVLPICAHPDNANGIVVYDLSVNPEPLLALSAAQIRERLFTKTDELPAGVERVPLKTVHLNKCPVLAPLGVLRESDQARLGLDLEAYWRHAEQIKNAPHVIKKVTEALTVGRDFNTTTDPDLMIYSGGFFVAQDRSLMTQIRATPPEQLAALRLNFQDERLNEMLFRYRARNFPNTLKPDEQQHWQQFCLHHLTQGNGDNRLTLAQFQQAVQQLQTEHGAQHPVLQQLEQFAQQKAAHYGL